MVTQVQHSSKDNKILLKLPRAGNYHAPLADSLHVGKPPFKNIHFDSGVAPSLSLAARSATGIAAQ